MLTPGTRFGPYEVISPLGAGGMGEVYRARDARLGRDVAIKVLPNRYGESDDRLRRFAREAVTTAAISHPNVLVVFDVGEVEGRTFLVSELLEGMTLRAVLHGPLACSQAIDYAIQIAKGLSAAHAKGIVHRDLKPENLFLTTEGRVKILDFGLARVTGGQVEAADGLESRTATDEGLVLGTVGYMAPEQARGQPADARSDIFALGAVLYEMVEGSPAFPGETPADTLSAILHQDPRPIAATHQPLALAVSRIVNQCVAKRPADRFQSAHDLVLALEALENQGVGLAGAGGQEERNTQTARHGGRRARPRVRASVAAAILVILAGALAKHMTRTVRPVVPKVVPATNSVIELPDEAQLSLGSRFPMAGFNGPLLAMSPDGTEMVYVGRSGPGTKLFLRPTAGDSVTPIAGTEGAIHPFFSPDGRSLGFLTNDKLKKVSLEGGEPVTLAAVAFAITATWTRDDVIYVAVNHSTSLLRVKAEGGGDTLIRVDDTSPRTPGSVPSRSSALRCDQVLPDGRWMLASDQPRSIGYDTADVLLLSLEGPETKVLVHAGYDARYVPPGYLLFARGGSLLAARFDVDRHEVLGDPVLIASGVSADSIWGRAQVAASDNGLLVYADGGDRAVGRLAWVDRKGETEPLDIPPRVYGFFDLSPTGDRVALHVVDVKDYVWIYDLRRREGRKRAGEKSSGWPLWTSDGSHLAFSSWRRFAPGEPWTLSLEDAYGNNAPRELLSDDHELSSGSWTPDGSVLAVNVIGKGIAFVPADAKTDVAGAALLPGMFPSFSPTGRWLAYMKFANDRGEVWVRSYPDGRVSRQVTTEGGVEPVWCPNGQLFYRQGNRWMSTTVHESPELTWDPPRLVFETDFVDTPGISYDVSPDGQRLLVLKPVEPGVHKKLHLVSNWTQALERGPGSDAGNGTAAPPRSGETRSAPRR